MARLRVYLAGPDVFLPDAVAAGEEKKRLCEKHGFEGVFPLDAEIEAGAPRSTGLRISAANEALIAGADLVIANMTPFRGPSADAGTAYEMGFARALGKRVLAYTESPDGFAPRTRAFLAERGALAPDGDHATDGTSIEAFDLADNLMLVGALAEQEHEPSRSFEECLLVAQRAANPTAARVER
ncbi:MAG TPA: nucleoside 2-deoxyribosyltransferase [Polyangiaceae bacterium]|nr:nucleoside 2-deoxyribosyltransferase [Polyangiaceae bacterium]